jgi:small subunit ribosomal protein S5e
MADVEEAVEEQQPEEEVEEEEPAEEEEEEYAVVGGAREVKLFGKWSFDDIEVRDISLVVSSRPDLVV